MVVNKTPSLAVLYQSLLQTRAAHSATGGPPLDRAFGDQQTGPSPQVADSATSGAPSSRVNILT